MKTFQRRSKVTQDVILEVLLWPSAFLVGICGPASAYYMMRHYIIPTIRLANSFQGANPSLLLAAATFRGHLHTLEICLHYLE